MLGDGLPVERNDFRNVVRPFDSAQGDVIPSGVEAS